MVVRFSTKNLQHCISEAVWIHSTAVQESNRCYDYFQRSLPTACVRYRFAQEIAASPPPTSRKRRNSGNASEVSSTAPPAKLKKGNLERAPNLADAESKGAQTRTRTEPGGAKLSRADTANAIETPRSFGKSAANGFSAEVVERSPVEKDGGTTQRETPSAVKYVLEDVMCGLCSELLLDAAVLPCSHCFCRLCWMDHKDSSDTT